MPSLLLSLASQITHMLAVAGEHMSVMHMTSRRLHKETWHTHCGPYRIRAQREGFGSKEWCHERLARV